MSSKSKKQTPPRKSASQPSTASGKKQTAKPRSAEPTQQSLASDTTGSDDKPVGQPSGATMETGAGDPSTDAPADALSGANEPEETKNAIDNEDGGDDEGPKVAPGDDPEALAILGEDKDTTMARSVVDVDATPERESAEPATPVDDATASIQWKGVPEEGVPDGIILEPDEDLYFEGDQNGNMITVTKNVYRKVFPRGCKKPSYTLLYRKGTQVSSFSAQGQNVTAPVSEDEEQDESEQEPANA